MMMMRWCRSCFNAMCVCADGSHDAADTGFGFSSLMGEDNSSLIPILKVSRHPPLTPNDSNENVTVSLNTYSDQDQAQLTVSSINTILEDLPLENEEDVLVNIEDNGPETMSNNLVSSSQPTVAADSILKPSALKSSVGCKEKLPVVSGVSFAPENQVILDLPRPRSRSDSSRPRFWPPKAARNSTEWSMGRLMWLRDRQRNNSSGVSSNFKNHETKLISVLKNSTAVNESLSAADVDNQASFRVRSSSEKYNRQCKKQVIAEVSRSAAFDWPLGRLGKMKQKYKDINRVTKTQSLSNIKEGFKGSRSGTGVKKTVAFAEEPWWSSTVKYFIEKGKAKSTRIRRRHLTDPDTARSRRTSPDGTSGIRRRALSLSTPHRGSDVNVDPENSLRLFRHHRSLPLKNQFIESYGSAKLKKIEDDEIFVKFFEFHKCYDLIPNSAKLVVFDTQLLVKKAFFALLYNGVRAAPLWDSVKQKFVGMLTITDFIRILQMLYVSQDQEMEELEEHKLETWRSLLDDVKELVYVNPDDSLLDAIHALICNKIHRLPIIDPINGNVLYIVTHKRILKFLFLYIRDLPQPDWVSKSIGDLGIGSYDNVIIATHKMPIIEALGKFINHRISALPIVDEVTGRLIDIYAKFDVINLAAEKIYANLDVTLKSANEHRNEWFEGVHSCLRSDSLMAVMLKLVETEVHRLIVVDEGSLVVGVISLSDILSFLVLQPELRNLETKKEKSASCSPASEAAGVCDYLSSFVVENDTILEADEDKTSIAESVTPTMIFPEPIRKDDAGLSCFQASSKMDKEDIEPISLAPISL